MKSFLITKPTLRAFWLSMFITRLAWAADPAPVDLKILPTALALGIGETRKVMVVAHNSTGFPIEPLRLDFLCSPGLAITNSTSVDQVLAAGASAHWLIDVSRTDRTYDTGEVHFRFDYRQKNSTSSVDVVDSQIASLEIHDRVLSTLDKLVDVSTESSVKVLQEKHPGTVFIIVKNKSNLPITVQTISPWSSPDISVNSSNALLNRLVPPQTEEAFPLILEVQSRVVPGRRIVLFDVKMAWEDQGQLREGSMLAHFDCAVEVLGDSDLLVAVGVPTFLLLPGFLFVYVFATLWNKTRTLSNVKQFELDLKSGGFWVWAVLVSLLAGLLYPVLYGYSFLDGYGRRDVFKVWFGSVIVAGLFWFFALAVLSIWQRTQKRLHQFNDTDTPIDVLQKLKRNKKGFKLSQVDAQIKGPQKVRAFLLNEADSTNTAIWVSPGVGLSLVDQIEASVKAEIEKNLNDALVQFNNPKILLALIKRYVKGKKIVVRWLAIDPLVGVAKATQVSPADVPERSLVGLL